MRKQISAGKIVLSSVSVDNAEVMFNLIEANRERLSPYLSWINSINHVRDQIEFYTKAQVQWANMQAFHFLINYNNQAAGAISVHTLDWQNLECELGYWIAKEFEGHGVVSEAISLIEAELKQNNLKKVKLRIHRYNVRSIKSAKSSGYKINDKAASNKLIYFFKEL